jgi:hypothetical protein
MVGSDADDPIDAASVRRENRARVIRALQTCTGNFGDDLAAPRVQAYSKDPVGSDPEEFAFVGALPLRRFYAFADKPDKNDRPVLWNRLLIEFELLGGKDPGKWGPDTSVSKLQRIAEQAVEKVDA